MTAMRSATGRLRLAKDWMTTWVIAVLLVVGFAGPSAADSSKPDGDRNWEVTLEPYLWVASVESTTGLGGAASPVGATFVDLVENIKMAFMGYASVRYRRLGLLADGNYLKVGQNVPLPFSPTPTITNVDVDAKVGFGTIAAFWRFEPADGLSLDPYMGARWWFVELPIQFNPVGLRLAPERAWADFVVGLALGYEITDRWFIESMADVGGGDSKVTWQIYGSTGYRFKDWFALTVGYRYIGVDYDERGFKFDSTLSGMLVGLKFTL